MLGMTMRAGVVVTGTEVLSGIVADRNGPWLSERLRERGVELAHIVVVADRPADVRAAQILAAIAHDHDLRQLDAVLAQPLRQPRAVAVGDDPRQHLGAGDDDAGAGHPAHCGRWSSGSARGLRPGRSS